MKTTLFNALLVAICIFLTGPADCFRGDNNVRQQDCSLAGIKATDENKIPNAFTAQVATLVKDGSAEAVEQLYVLVRSGDPPAFAAASRGIIQIAEQAFLNGDKDQALRHANNIWLSSSPHDARQAAWNLMFVDESAPRIMPAGHQVLVKAPGGRDHSRFAEWLRSEYTEKYPWILDVQVHYQPTLVSEGRAGENAWVTFVLENQNREQDFLKLLLHPTKTFSTDEWSFIREMPLRDAVK